jgi:hypothetical protein
MVLHVANDRKFSIFWFPKKRHQEKLDAEPGREARPEITSRRTLIRRELRLHPEASPTKETILCELLESTYPAPTVAT